MVGQISFEIFLVRGYIHVSMAAEVEQNEKNVGWRPVPIAERKIGLYKRTRRYKID